MLITVSCILLFTIICSLSVVVFCIDSKPHLHLKLIKFLDVFLGGKHKWLNRDGSETVNQ